jgi:transposase InsO family protein
MIAQLQQAVPTVPVTTLCTLFGVSRSWYYARSLAETAERDVALRAAIETIVLAFPGYGYRRVTKQLQRDGWRVNHKRVLRIMRQEALLCQLQRRFVVTTDARHDEPTYPNLLKEVVLDHLDQVWVADLTYIRLPREFVYLAAILDAFSRRCLGWALSRWIDTQLTLAALEQALAYRQPLPGLIHHSDRGVQYASHAYVARLGQAGIACSMAAPGNPYENAQAESFFKTLKTEEVYLHTYRTFDEAEAHLDHFIEDVYNAKRLHSRLGYVPPLEFEAAWTVDHVGDLSLTLVR